MKSILKEIDKPLEKQIESTEDSDESLIQYLQETGSKVIEEEKPPVDDDLEADIEADRLYLEWAAAEGWTIIEGLRNDRDIQVNHVSVPFVAVEPRTFVERDLFVDTVITIGSETKNVQLKVDIGCDPGIAVPLPKFRELYDNLAIRPSTSGIAPYWRKNS